MRASRLIVAHLSVLLCMSYVAVGQEPEKAVVAKSSTHAFIYPIAFSDKATGIREFLDMNRQLDGEFEPEIREISILAGKLSDLGQEIEQTSKKIEVSKAWLEAKLLEYESVHCKTLIRREDFKMKYERRFAELSKPISALVLEALKQYAKENGFSVILDASKMISGGDGFSISLNVTPDITKNFVEYFNRRSRSTVSR